MTKEIHQEIIKAVVVHAGTLFVSVIFKNSNRCALLWKEDYNRLKKHSPLSLIAGTEVTVEYCKCDLAMCPRHLSVNGITINAILICHYDDEGAPRFHRSAPKR